MRSKISVMMLSALVVIFWMAILAADCAPGPDGAGGGNGGGEVCYPALNPTPPVHTGLMGGDLDWRAQDYQYSPDSMGSQGVTGVSYDATVDSLILQCDLVFGDSNRSQGEILLDLKHNLGLETVTPLDLSHSHIFASIEVPPGFVGPPSKRNSAVIFVKDQPEGDNDQTKSEYGGWANFCAPGRYSIYLDPAATAPPNGYMDAGFDPTRITTIGIKLGLNGTSVPSYQGEIIIRNIGINPVQPMVDPPQLPSPPPPPLFTSPGDTLSVQSDGFYNDAKKVFVVGGNWRVIEYGQNFGSNRWSPWGNGVSKHQKYVIAKMEMFRKTGISLVRVGLLDDGASMVDKDDKVIGYNDAFKADVTFFLDQALAHDLRVEFTLLDFLFAFEGSTVSEVRKMGHRNVIEDPAVRAAFFNDFLVPFLNDFGNHQALWGLDVINEPEWIIAQADGGDWESFTNSADIKKPDPHLDFARFSNFVTECIQTIKLKAPDKLVTVGVSITNINMTNSFTLDYLAPHFYPKMGDLPANIDNLPPNVPWILEEYPANGDVPYYLDTAYTKGGGGALIWNLSPEIDNVCYSFEQEEQKLNEIRAFVDAH